MKAIIFLITIFSISSYAGDNCSINTAKKFAAAVIAVETAVNKYEDGKLVFSKSNSNEYTKEYLTEQAKLSGSTYAEKYLKLKAELEQNPDLRIYRLQFKWQRPNNVNTGFYYIVRLKNYSNGCTLNGLTAD